MQVAEGVPRRPVDQRGAVAEVLHGMVKHIIDCVRGEARRSCRILCARVGRPADWSVCNFRDVSGPDSDVDDDMAALCADGLDRCWQLVGRLDSVAVGAH